MFKNLFEKELAAHMQNELIKQANEQNFDNLEKAVDYLNSAMGIFEDFGMNAQADMILNFLSKIANNKDPYTKNLTSEDMIKNLKHHGTEFALLDSNNSDDVLDIEINDINSSEDLRNKDTDWED